MRYVILVGALLLGVQSASAQDSGPLFWCRAKDPCSWVLHGALSIGVTEASRELTGSPWWGASLAFAGFTVKELHERRVWGSKVSDLDQSLDMLAVTLGSFGWAWMRGGKDKVRVTPLSNGLHVRVGL